VDLIAGRERRGIVVGKASGMSYSVSFAIPDSRDNEVSRARIDCAKVERLATALDMENGLVKEDGVRVLLARLI
jgi:hypothetical protein